MVSTSVRQGRTVSCRHRPPSLLCPPSLLLSEKPLAALYAHLSTLHASRGNSLTHILVNILFSWFTVMFFNILYSTRVRSTYIRLNSSASFILCFFFYSIMLTSLIDLIRKSTSRRLKEFLDVPSSAQLSIFAPTNCYLRLYNVVLLVNFESSHIHT